MYISRRTGGGRGVYEFAGYADAGYSIKDLENKEFILVIPEKIRFNLGIILSHQGGKPRLVLKQPSIIHIQRQLAVLLLLPKPIRADTGMGEHLEVLESERYVIEKIELAEINVSDETVEIHPEFVIAKNLVAEIGIDVEERMEKIIELWANADDYPEPINKLLHLHKEILESGFYLDVRAENLVKDLQQQCELQSTELGVVYKKEFDVLFALSESNAGFSDTISITNPDEITETALIPGKPIFEGAAKKVIVNAYERNPKARKLCIEHYGFSCTVCGMDFETIYGEIGKKYIHVHHLKLISEIKDEYEINPIDDLRPVCPNCHAMIHRKNPPYSIEEIKYIIQQK